MEMEAQAIGGTSCAVADDMSGWGKDCDSGRTARWGLTAAAPCSLLLLLLNANRGIRG